jgi:hypothetical protein
VAALVTVGGWLVHYGYVAADTRHHEERQDRQIAQNTLAIEELRTQIKDLGILLLEQAADTRSLLLRGLQVSPADLPKPCAHELDQD